MSEELSPYTLPALRRMIEGFAPNSVWERILPSLPAGYDREALYRIFNETYQKMIGNRAFKQGNQEHRGSFQGVSVVALRDGSSWDSPVNLRITAVTPKGAIRIERTVSANVGWGLAAAWAYAKDVLGDLLGPKYTDERRFFTDLHRQSSGELVEDQLNMLCDWPYLLTGDWKRDIESARAWIQAEYKKKTLSPQDERDLVLARILTPFASTPRETFRFLKSTRVPSSRTLESFSTPEAVLQDWLFFPLDVDTWKGVLFYNQWHPYITSVSDRVGPTPAWKALYHTPAQEGFKVKPWVEWVEKQLAQMRKEQKLRLGTKAYKEALREKYEEARANLETYIARAQDEARTEYEARAAEWVAKAEEQERYLLKQEQDWSLQGYFAFAKFYKVRADTSEAEQALASIQLVRRALRDKIAEVEHFTPWGPPAQLADEVLEQIPDLREIKASVAPITIQARLIAKLKEENKKNSVVLTDGVRILSPTRFVTTRRRLRALYEAVDGENFDKAIHRGQIELIKEIPGPLRSIDLWEIELHSDLV